MSCMCAASPAPTPAFRKRCAAPSPASPIPVAIDHLKRLGVTTVELLPAAAWVDERHLQKFGLTNYWGYNPVAFMAPDPRLAPGGWAEVRASTRALADAGIETLLDVVVNHSGECDALGPVLSLKGLDNADYYRLRPGNLADYVDDAGTGDTLALDRAHRVRLVMGRPARLAPAGGHGGASASTWPPSWAAVPTASIPRRRCSQPSTRTRSCGA